MRSRLWGSTPTVGSSRSSTFGRWSTPQAMLTRRFIPPENVLVEIAGPIRRGRSRPAPSSPPDESPGPAARGNGRRPRGSRGRSGPDRGRSPAGRSRASAARRFRAAAVRTSRSRPNRGHPTAEAPHQRRLAGAVRSQKGQALALAQLEAGALERDGGSEPPGHVPDAKRREPSKREPSRDRLQPRRVAVMPGPISERAISSRGFPAGPSGSRARSAASRRWQASARARSGPRIETRVVFPSSWLDVLAGGLEGPESVQQVVDDLEEDPHVHGELPDGIDPRPRDSGDQAPASAAATKRIAGLLAVHGPEPSASAGLSSGAQVVQLAGDHPFASDQASGTERRIRSGRCASSIPVAPAMTP